MHATRLSSRLPSSGSVCISNLERLQEVIKSLSEVSYSPLTLAHVEGSINTSITADADRDLVVVAIPMQAGPMLMQQQVSPLRGTWSFTRSENSAS